MSIRPLLAHQQWWYGCCCLLLPLLLSSLQNDSRCFVTAAFVAAPVRRSPYVIPTSLTTRTRITASSSRGSSSCSSSIIDTAGASSSSSSSSDDTTSYIAPLAEIERRRNLAIISHPDSGKTTMTEKLLLYGGALQMAGAVRQKGEQRSTQSDFMEMEKARGISISATVMTFDYNTLRINILDTPGHQDFSEDTYRALAAADNAVMLLDAAKGLEPQTRKLFEVCRMRSLPLFTFVNKMDRPALSPYTIMDQIESEFGLATYPVLWPIGDGDRFKGVLDRMTNIVHLFDRGDKRGGKAGVQQVHMSDITTLQSVIADDELYNKLIEDTELLNELIAPLDMNRVLAGTQSPLFFGSAMTNFGVQLFLDKFCDMGTRPSGRLLAASTTTDKMGSKSSSVAQDETNKNTDDDNESSLIISPNHHEFSGFVFKTQANLDPRHRDRLAYIRIVSGSFHKGMKVGHSRSKPNKRYNLATAQTLFGSDRESIEVAYPGDVIGINNPGNFAIGYVVYFCVALFFCLLYVFTYLAFSMDAVFCCAACAVFT